ncbi:MAG: TetR/AcrR family transcriptional regulator [Candidatus Binataceae bacterium]
MQILHEKPDTRRPAIVRAATRLFSRRGIDATSMREIADAAGVREAAIYRHFAGKEEMSRDIFASWYGWYSSQLREIASGTGTVREKVYRIVRLELTAAEDHTEAFVYFCQNETRFLPDLPRQVPRAREALSAMLREGQRGQEVRAGDVGLLADMFSGALCGAALSWIHRGRRGKLSRQAAVIGEGCWRLIAANAQSATSQGGRK